MTTLRPAYEATLCHGDHAVTLRASLRAAVALDNLPGGFPALVEQIAGQNLTTIKVTIRAAAPDRQQAERLLSSLDGAPLQPFMAKAQPACLALIAAILPQPSEAAESRTSAPKGEPKPWAEHFAELFAYGTGWLGWAPDTVWNASADELTAAFEAHVERLIAMNGGSTTDDPDDDPAKEAQRQANIDAGLDPDFDRNALRALKAKMS